MRGWTAVSCCYFGGVRAKLAEAAAGNSAAEPLSKRFYQICSIHVDVLYLVLNDIVTVSIQGRLSSIW